MTDFRLEFRLFNPDDLVDVAEDIADEIFERARALILKQRNNGLWSKVAFVISVEEDGKHEGDGAVEKGAV